jgi:hypothetical protein
VLVDNIFATLWGLIAFAGFVTALLMPKTDEYQSQLRETVDEDDREVAARWSAAVRVTPVAVLGGVIAVAVAAVATAGWGTGLLGQMNFWLLIVAVVSQAGFAFTVRYLVAAVPREFPRIAPLPGNAWRAMRSRGGAKTAIRFDNKTSGSLVLEWIGFDGAPAQRQEIEPGDWLTQVTYVEHCWRISTPDNADVATFMPLSQVAVAEVTQDMLPAGSAQPI